MEEREKWAQFIKSDNFQFVVKLLHHQEVMMFHDLLVGDATAVAKLKGIEDLRCTLERIAEHVGALSSKSKSLFGEQTVRTGRAGLEPITG